jgi:hypothetical protein
MPVPTPLTEQQKYLGVFALRSLLEKDAARFPWLWSRPEDFKDVLSTTVDGLKIELIKYARSGEGCLFLRYGGDTCGAVITDSDEGRKLFQETWDKVLSIAHLLKSRVITDATRRSAETLKEQLETELAKEMAEGDAVLS